MSVTKEEVLEKLGDKDVVVLNVLGRGNFDKLRIKGSHSLPIVGVPADDFVRKAETEFGRKPLFITYCTGIPCRHFQEAAEALQKRGFRAEGYEGGIKEWSESGLPVEGSQV